MPACWTPLGLETFRSTEHSWQIIMTRHFILDSFLIHLSEETSKWVYFWLKLSNYCQGPPKGTLPPPRQRNFSNSWQMNGTFRSTIHAHVHSMTDRTEIKRGSTNARSKCEGGVISIKREGWGVHCRNRENRENRHTNDASDGEGERLSVEKILFSKCTEYQCMDIAQSNIWGKILFLVSSLLQNDLEMEILIAIVAGWDCSIDRGRRICVSRVFGIACTLESSKPQICFFGGFPIALMLMDAGRRWRGSFIEGNIETQTGGTCSYGGYRRGITSVHCALMSCIRRLSKHARNICQVILTHM